MFSGYFSIIGVVVSVIGFAWTVAVALASKEAAQRAEAEIKETAGRVTSRLKESDSASDLGMIIGALNEIKGLHGVKDVSYELVLFKYTMLRAKLVTLMSGDIVSVLEDEKLKVQEIIAEISLLERLVSTKVVRNTDLDAKELAIEDLVSRNPALADHVDALNGILTRIKQSGGGGNVG
ncbi:hypothetical protein [Salinicola sp. RZ23]|uniref:hypothetical protein n=1 Tax=Salinicola sp. RZ23 TaxID=1949087 RepID=UPI001300A16E|nr:hypothetical protein [Salinicola sp. RZ23]